MPSYLRQIPTPPEPRLPPAPKKAALSNDGRLAEPDREEVSTRCFAGQVARFYKQLLLEGVPGEDALELTHTFIYWTRNSAVEPEPFA